MRGLELITVPSVAADTRAPGSCLGPWRPRRCPPVSLLGLTQPGHKDIASVGWRGSAPAGDDSRLGRDAVNEPYTPLPPSLSRPFRRGR